MDKCMHSATATRALPIYHALSKTNTTKKKNLKEKRTLWCNALYLLHKQNNSHESRFNLIELLTNNTHRL